MMEQRNYKKVERSYELKECDENLVEGKKTTDYQSINNIKTLYNRSRATGLRAKKTRASALVPRTYSIDYICKNKKKYEHRRINIGRTKTKSIIQKCTYIVKQY